MVQTIKKYFEAFDKVTSVIASVTLLLMMLWIFTDVTLRATINSPIKGTLEITGEYLMVILIYLSISYTQKHNGHVKVTMFEERFPHMVRNITRFITNLIAAGFFLFIGILNYQAGLDYLERGIRSTSVLNYPLAPALFIIALGLFMITLRLIIENVLIVTEKRETNTYVVLSTSEQGKDE